MQHVQEKAPASYLLSMELGYRVPLAVSANGCPDSCFTGFDLNVRSPIAETN